MLAKDMNRATSKIKETLMKRIDYVLFDLDGTLTDPGIGITNGVMFALNSFGIDVNDRSELFRFIGPPLRDSFRDFYGMSADEAELAVKKYREYYSVSGLFENEVYPGVRDMLKELSSMGKKLAVATSKPTEFSVKILEHFGLLDHFAFVAGSEFDGTRDKKEDVIRFALKRLGIFDPSSAIMVGDRKFDILGARTCGMDAIGVLYGYGDRCELNAAGAVACAKDAFELNKLLTSL